jgi:hypothetical protein
MPWRERQHTPAEHYRTYPGRWSKLLQYHVAWDFEEDVRDEEHEQRDIVVFSFHLEVFREALDLGVADVDAGEASVM